MTPTNVLFMLAIPVGVMGLIAFVLLAGPLKPKRRQRLELLMMSIFYPGMALFFGWRTLQMMTNAEWVSAALSAALVCILTGQAIALVRKRSRADGTRT